LLISSRIGKSSDKVIEEMKTFVHFTTRIFPKILQFTTFYKQCGKASWFGAMWRKQDVICMPTS